MNNTKSFKTRRKRVKRLHSGTTSAKLILKFSEGGTDFI